MPKVPNATMIPESYLTTHYPRSPSLFTILSLSLAVFSLPSPQDQVRPTEGGYYCTGTSCSGVCAWAPAYKAPTPSVSPSRNRLIPTSPLVLTRASFANCTKITASQKWNHGQGHGDVGGQDKNVKDTNMPVIGSWKCKKDWVGVKVGKKSQ